jgi:hypothetical protein
MPRSQSRARFLLSGKSGTEAPRHEDAGSDLPSGPASRSGSQAEISRGACCASHVTHPTTPGGAVKGSCAGVPGPLGPDSVWEHPRPQIGSHRALRRAFGPKIATSPRGHELRAWYPRAWSQ